VGSPGLSALALFERAGMIKRVVPLARPPEPESALLGMRSVMAALAETVGSPAATDVHAGVSLVEMERGSDVAHLQLALAQDPHI
jgi:hypothetical protein